MRRRLKSILHPSLKKWAEQRSSKSEDIHYDGLNVRVYPGVFHPLIFSSTLIMYDYLLSQELRGLSILELGAGSGLLSFMCAREGGEVVASDINPRAIEGLYYNNKFVKNKVEICQSNLFEGIDHKKFDRIIINPPYYARDPETWWEYAFYAGQQNEYFRDLFAGIPNYLQSGGCCWMILSRDLDQDSLFQYCTHDQFERAVVYSRRKRWEWFDIFEISVYNS